MAILVWVVYAFVGTFVFGLFVYNASRPVYRRLKRRIRPPSLAAAVSLFALDPSHLTATDADVEPDLALERPARADPNLERA